MNDRPFAPDWFSKPGETVTALMVRHALTPNSLAEQLGCDIATIRALLLGTLEIDRDKAVRLSHCLGATPAFWQNRQSIYQKALSRAADAIPENKRAVWLKKFPLKDMAEYGWIDRPARRADVIKTYIAYFGVTGPDEWEKRYTSSLDDVAFRASPSFDSKIGALSAWLRQGEIEAALVRCAAWNPELLRHQLIELRQLTKAKAPSYFAKRLRDICAAAGVAVVFARAPTGCRASGATRFISPDKAMMVLSFRHLSDDHFWFTFFHEIGHLLLHEQSTTFVEGETNPSTEREREANAFSARVLVPQDRREELLDLRPRKENIIRFAVSIGISPGIVVGQLQHLGVIRPNQLNFLKRRYAWDEIVAAFT